MNPDIYFRIVFLILSREIVVTGFSIFDFLSHFSNLKNILAQGTRYSFAFLKSKPNLLMERSYYYL